MTVVAVNKSTKFLSKDLRTCDGVNIVTRSPVFSELSVCFISNICSMYRYTYLYICKDPLCLAAFLLGIDAQKGYTVVKLSYTCFAFCLH
jgi:hypothetical protein